MDDILRRIKRAVQAGRIVFTDKADIELVRDGLSRDDIVESIYQATAIAKTLRSTNPSNLRRREYLHVIISPNFDGTFLYSKGKLSEEFGVDVFYVLVSAKMAD